MRSCDGSSWDFVRAAQHGDEDGLARLYRRYQGFVYRYVLSRTRSPALADDLTSETFLRVLRHIGSVHERGEDFRAWVTTVARNVVTDHHRSARREILVPQAMDPSQVLECAETTVLRRQQRDELFAAIGQLSPRQRDCVLLRFFLGLSVGQTAALMGSEPGAIRALQYRALRGLGPILAGSGVGEHGAVRSAA